MTWTAEKIAEARKLHRSASTISSIASRIGEPVGEITMLLFGGWHPALAVAPQAVVETPSPAPIVEAPALPDRAEGATEATTLTSRLRALVEEKGSMTAKQAAVLLGVENPEKIRALARQGDIHLRHATTEERHAIAIASASGRPKRAGPRPPSVPSEESRKQLAELKEKLVGEARTRLGAPAPVAVKAMRPLRSPDSLHGGAARPPAPVHVDGRIKIRLRDPSGAGFLHFAGEGMTKEPIYAWQGTAAQLMALRQKFSVPRHLIVEAVPKEQRPKL